MGLGGHPPFPAGAGIFPETPSAAKLSGQQFMLSYSLLEE